MAGGAAIVLATLGLIGILPNVLGSIAVIAVGAALLIAGGAIAASFTRVVEANAAPGMTRHSVVRGMGGEAMMGVAGIVLGILGLAHHDPITLSLVAMLAIGASILLSGSALAARFFSMFHSRRMKQFMSEPVVDQGGQSR